LDAAVVGPNRDQNLKRQCRVYEPIRFEGSLESRDATLSPKRQLPIVVDDEALTIPAGHDDSKLIAGWRALQLIVRVIAPSGDFPGFRHDALREHWLAVPAWDD
jgi:hypothetical protein